MNPFYKFDEHAHMPKIVEELKKDNAKLQKALDLSNDFLDAMLKIIEHADRILSNTLKEKRELNEKIAILKDYIVNLVPECENCQWQSNYNKGWDTDMCRNCDVLSCNWKHKDL